MRSAHNLKRQRADMYKMYIKLLNQKTVKGKTRLSPDGIGEALEKRFYLDADYCLRIMAEYEPPKEGK